MANVSESKIFQIDTGILKVKDACIVLIRTEWNAEIVDELVNGCVEELEKHEVKKIITITVPGAMEIPFGILTYLESVSKKKRPNAFIALGCVIKGDTPHFDYICTGVTEGILQLNLSLPMPTIFGILTVENKTQAEERTGGSKGHKGQEAALTALKMIHLQQSLRKQSGK